MRYLLLPAGLVTCGRLVQRVEGRERGWGHWGGAATHSPSARASGKRCELPSGVRGRSRPPPGRPKVFHYFQHSGSLLLTLILLIVDYRAAIGAKGPRPPWLPLLCSLEGLVDLCEVFVARTRTATDSFVNAGASLMKNHRFA